MRTFSVVCIVHNKLNPHYIYLVPPKNTSGIGLPHTIVQDSESLPDACLRMLSDNIGITTTQDNLYFVTDVVIGNIPTTVYRCSMYDVEEETPLGTFQQINIDYYPNPTDNDNKDHIQILANYSDRLKNESGFFFEILPGVRDIIIKTKVQQLKPVNCYEVISTFYSGDADAFETVTAFVPVEQKDEMIKLLHLRCMISHDNIIHNRVSNWPDWASDVYYSTVVGHWPSDVYTDGECASTPDGITLYYYDNNSNKYECEIIV